MKIVNNNEKFGEAGPFEAESFVSLADEMSANFEYWAKELCSSEYSLGDWDDLKDKLIAKIRDEFIAGLERVPPRAIGEIFRDCPQKPYASNEERRLDAWINPEAEGDDDKYIVAEWEFGQDIYPYYADDAYIDTDDGWEIL